MVRPARFGSNPETAESNRFQHPKTIAMGLERVRAVAQRMALPKPARHVITVGGTNGKGSTVAFIEAIARAADWRVGAYTSPHLLRYNERVRIDGEDADDASLVAAFEAVEVARGETSGAGPPSRPFAGAARWLRCGSARAAAWISPFSRWGSAVVSMRSTSSIPTSR